MHTVKAAVVTWLSHAFAEHSSVSLILALPSNFHYSAFRTCLIRSVEVSQI